MEVHPSFPASTSTHQHLVSNAPLFGSEDAQLVNAVADLFWAFGVQQVGVARVPHSEDNAPTLPF